jgi:hypothetical protein
MGPKSGPKRFQKGTKIYEKDDWIFDIFLELSGGSGTH